MKVPAAFFEVSPQWARVISEAKTVKELSGFVDHNGRMLSDGHGFDGNIQNYNQCIVGEAHHFNFADNTCHECRVFSDRFGAILHGAHDGHGNRKQQLMQNIEDFTNHWRDKHNPMIGIKPEIAAEPEAIKQKV